VVAPSRKPEDQDPIDVELEKEDSEIDAPEIDDNGDEDPKDKDTDGDDEDNGAVVSEQDEITMEEIENEVWAHHKVDLAGQKVCNLNMFYCTIANATLGRKTRLGKTRPHCN
jgi:hypothetical protein